MKRLRDYDLAGYALIAVVAIVGWALFLFVAYRAAGGIAELDTPARYVRDLWSYAGGMDWSNGRTWVVFGPPIIANVLFWGYLGYRLARAVAIGTSSEFVDGRSNVSYWRHERAKRRLR